MKAKTKGNKPKEFIELKGKCIESFERVSKIKEIILIGEDDEIRRIILK